MVAIAGLLVAAGLLTAFIPDFAGDARDAAQRFITRPVPPTELPPAATAHSPTITFRSLMFAVGSVVGAVVVASFQLFRHRLLPARLLRAQEALLRPTYDALRRLHSGHVGDYLAWMMVGFAVLAATFGLSLGLGPAR
ncbi:MAG TPA: hypothetical protein VFJ14_13620 [Nocardioidaceae bacterium]|nr:hypothetical protein [Nocardioidaceae bacterium]